ncbi:MAG TPA: hypothetical protein VH480_22345 [Streptosporangiaceae bacterium]
MAIFSAIVGIPMWLVFKRPDTGQEIAAAAARSETVPLHSVSLQEAVQSRHEVWSRQAA